MFKFYSSEKIDMLTKSQENLEKCQETLEKSQKNIEKITQLIVTNNSNCVLQSNSQQNPNYNKIEKSEEEKLKAAYALNLCTVSVSQIIEYNDVNFLENEYNTILNNLNLEEMPKDEALLQILKQLLDVITFFKIQEGDKKMLEYAYQQKMKNAVWSAIPNPAVILAGGSPINMAISLASQVGIGYMNYRKEKAKIALENEEKKWELQRSAIEQFNALRRELFDTAWRLADEYNFPDNYRLTENQITQFNKILLDTDNIRKFERLTYISDKFEAYPPFWYYLGNAANSIYQENSVDEFRQSFKNDAIKCFDKFLELTQSNLLREDQLIASAALEKFDLIEDHNEKIKLLQIASSSTTSLDVKQLCAISYLKIGETVACCKLLKMLVNEQYNEILNAQLLSKLYVEQFISKSVEDAEKNYKMLESRIDKPILFPMPEETENNEHLSKIFIEQQKKNFISNIAETFEIYIVKKETEYNNYLLDKSGNLKTNIVNFIKRINDDINILMNNPKPGFVLNHLKSCKTGLIEKLQNMLTNPDINQVSFSDLFKDVFSDVASNINSTIFNMKEISEISELEAKLFEFKIAANINDDYQKVKIQHAESTIEELLFNDQFYADQELIKNRKIVLDIFEKLNISEENLVKNSLDYTFHKYDSIDFKNYIRNNNKDLEKCGIEKNEIVGILDKKDGNSNDIIFTISAFYMIGKLKGPDNFTKYKDITWNEKGDLEIGEFKTALRLRKISSENLNKETWEALRNEFASMIPETICKSKLSKYIKECFEYIEKPYTISTNSISENNISNPYTRTSHFNKYLVSTAFLRIFGYNANPGNEQIRNNAASEICQNEIETSDIVHIFDNSVLQKGKSGIVLTDKAIYVKDMTNNTTKFSALYSDIDSVSTESSGKTSVIILKMKNAARYEISIFPEEHNKLVQLLNYAKKKKS